MNVFVFNRSENILTNPAYKMSKSASFSIDDAFQESEEDKVSYLDA